MLAFFSRPIALLISLALHIGLLMLIVPSLDVEEPREPATVSIADFRVFSEAAQSDAEPAELAEDIRAEESRGEFEETEIADTVEAERLETERQTPEDITLESERAETETAEARPDRVDGTTDSGAAEASKEAPVAAAEQAANETELVDLKTETTESEPEATELVDQTIESVRAPTQDGIDGDPWTAANEADLAPAADQQEAAVANRVASEEATQDDLRETPDVVDASEATRVNDLMETTREASQQSERVTERELADTAGLAAEPERPISENAAQVEIAQAQTAEAQQSQTQEAQRATAQAATATSSDTNAVTAQQRNESVAATRAQSPAAGARVSVATPAAAATTANQATRAERTETASVAVSRRPSNTSTAARPTLAQTGQASTTATTTAARQRIATATTASRPVSSAVRPSSSRRPSEAASTASTAKATSTASAQRAQTTTRVAASAPTSRLSTERLSAARPTTSRPAAARPTPPGPTTAGQATSRPGLQVAARAERPAPTKPQFDEPVPATLIPDEDLPTASDKPVRDFLATYDGGSCFTAMPSNEVQIADAGAPFDQSSVIEIFGAAIAPAQQLDADLRDTYGFEPKAQLRLLDELQCPVLDAWEALNGVSGPLLQLDLETDLMTSGQALRGQILRPSEEQTTDDLPEKVNTQLLIVDDDGKVHNVARYLSTGGDLDLSSARFSIPVTAIDNDATQTALIIALTILGEASVDFDSMIAKDSSADAIFKTITEAAQSAPGVLSMAVKYFEVEQR